jgi:hypothetical protein
MKTPTRFKDLASGQRFQYLGRPFTKTAFSLAVDETNDEFIFMGEIGVEPLGVVERNGVEEAYSV